HREGINCLAVTADGQSLLTGSADKSLKLWHMDGREALSLNGPDEIWTVACTPDSKTAASAGKDDDVTLWDLTTGRAVRTLQGHTACVRPLAIHPDGKYLVSAGNDRTVRGWDLSTGEAMFSHEEADYVISLAFSPDGNLLACGNDDGHIRIRTLPA